jgi:hypothetical protein
MPTWCSAAIEAGTSLAFLMALMRVNSGAIGLEPSASTAASSRPLAQKSPSSFCTLPCGGCGVEQFTLLLAAAVGQLAQRGGGAGLWHQVGLQPARIGGVVEVAALGADGRRARGLLLGGERIVGRDQGRQADAQGDGKRTEIGHVERIVMD